MRSVLSNPLIYRRRGTSDRQRKYLQSRTTDRGPVVKHEQTLQLSLCEWLRTILPLGVHFTSETGAGAFNSEYEKELHNRQQSSDSQPDIKIYAGRRGFHGLFIELKAEGTNLRKQRDGSKILVKRKSVPPSRKHPDGWKIVERDYKIRMKGDWATLHIEKQAKVLEDYRKCGYSAWFAVGEVNFKKIVCWYFEILYQENASIF